MPPSPFLWLNEYVQKISEECLIPENKNLIIWQTCFSVLADNSTEGYGLFQSWSYCWIWTPVAYTDMCSKEKKLPSIRCVSNLSVYFHLTTFFDAFRPHQNNKGHNNFTTSTRCLSLSRITFKLHDTFAQNFLWKSEPNVVNFNFEADLDAGSVRKRILQHLENVPFLIIWLLTLIKCSPNSPYYTYRLVQKPEC